MMTRCMRSIEVPVFAVFKAESVKVKYEKYGTVSKYLHGEGDCYKSPV